MIEECLFICYSPFNILDDDDLKQTEQSRSKTLKLDIAEKSQQITECMNKLFF